MIDGADGMRRRRIFRDSQTAFIATTFVVWESRDYPLFRGGQEEILTPVFSAS